jgi:hypothetical protein
LVKFSFRPLAGFALIITLALLALLVLAVVALSTLVRVGGQVSSAGTYQVQARQNALTGLQVGLSELQRHAGDDTRITAIAGITGIAANAGNTTRHWCGVWRSDGTFVAWLASGAQGAPTAALQNGLIGIELVSAGSVGAPAANSEHVIAGKIPIVVAETPGAPGVAATIGHYAFLVIDEGVKTPASSPAPLPLVAPVIFANTPNAQSRLRDTLAAHATRVPQVISYEQLAVLPAPAAALTPATLQDNFHHVTLASRSLNGNQLHGGMVNVNTNSAIFWRNLLQTYNTVPGIPASMTSATVSTRGTNIQNSLPAFATAGKYPNGPFTSITSFSNYLATIFPATGFPTAAQILAAIGSMLTVRTDTFRLRAYGETLNPADPAKTESIACCEAIVQRTADSSPNGLGRKFVILYFRWLGPDDI